MTIAFRVDASDQIGTGHVMRCLALARRLRRHGARIRFVFRHMPPHLRTMIADAGCEMSPLDDAAANDVLDELPHAHFLGTSQTADACAAGVALSDLRWDWLVVDHYALDCRWESPLRRAAERILAIDDLADRVHDADALLDQNLYTNGSSRYTGKVPVHCRLWLGPAYALLRDEFTEWRARVQLRSGPLRRLLVFFGGVDAANLTAKTVDALATAGGFRGRVDVVIGRDHAARAAIGRVAAEAGFSCEVQTERMAELMAAADLAIGASGSASWERCCLGLPAIVVPVADNQRAIAAGLEAAGAAWNLGDPAHVTERSLLDAVTILGDDAARLTRMSTRAFALLDGHRDVAALMSSG